MLTRSLPQSSRLQARTDRSAVQLFEWLALMEAVGYEDLDFLSLSGDVMEWSAQSMLGTQTVLLPLSGVNKRLLVMPLSEWQGRDVLRHGDVVCVHAGNDVAQHADKITSFFEVVRSTPGLMACLGWRCSEGDVDPVKRCGSVAQQIAWQWHSPGTRAAVQGGLFFSPQWAPGVSVHVARVIVKYMQTLSPAMAGDRLSVKLE